MKKKRKGTFLMEITMTLYIKKEKRTFCDILKKLKKKKNEEKEMRGMRRRTQYCSSKD